MRKIILTSIIAILSLSFNAMAASPNVIHDTMDYKNMADLKESGGWKVQGSTNTITDEKYAKLIMENDGKSVCDSGIIKELSPYLSGIATIEFDFMQQSEKSNCRIMDLRGYQADKNSNTRMICFVDISEGNVIARGEGHGDMGVGEVLIEDYEPDCWYNIKILVDTRLNTICFYVNNELKLQMASLQTYESISAIKFATNNATDVSKTKENGANICIDNVSLSNSDKGNSIKSISIANDAGELFVQGTLKSELNLLNTDSIETQEFLLFTTLYKNKVITFSKTASVSLPFGYADKLVNEIQLEEVNENDILEVKNYLFFKTDENKYKIADAIVSADKEGTSYGEGDFSVATDDAKFVTAQIEYAEEKIVINGKLDKSGSMVNAFVFEDEIPQEWDFDKIVAISGTKLGENNEFNIPIEFGSGFSSGEYAVLLMCGNPESEYELSFLYVSETERNEFIDCVNTLVTNEDTVALAEYLKTEENQYLMNSMNVIFKENTEYDFGAIAQYIISNKKEITDENVADAINEAIAYNLIAKSTESNFYDNLLLYGSFLGIETDEALDDEIKSGLVKKLMGFDYMTAVSTLEFAQYYNRAVALTVLNDAEFSELENIILKYNDIFKIDMGRYNSLSGLNKSKVMQSLAKNEIETVETDTYGQTNIAKLFSTIVKDVIKAANASRGGGGGSGGGSGSSGSAGNISNSTVTKVFVEENNTPKEEQVQKKRPFTDLSKEHWAYDDIYYLYDNAIMSGVNEKTVSPDRPVLREEFVKMIVAAFFEIDTKAENDFSDVDRDDWFAPSVSTAVKLSLIQGYDGKFGTGSNIKRQDAILILSKVADVKGVKLEEAEYFLNDLDSVSDYALLAVKKMAASGIVSGDDNKNFNPLNNITRAETAKLIREFIKVMK